MIAARTRSRASRMALSASPTIVNAGSPCADVGLDPDAARLDAVDRERDDAGEHGSERRLQVVEPDELVAVVERHADRVEPQLGVARPVT